MLNLIRLWAVQRLKVLGVCCLHVVIIQWGTSTVGVATPTDDIYSVQPAPTMQTLTSVNDLSDVQPTDWAYQALQILVERYGILLGDRDRQFRGNQSMSRAEFVAGLNSAMIQMDALLDAEFAQYARQEDLALLQQLQTKFAADLAAAKAELPIIAAIPENLDQIRNRTFSAMTKLQGEAIFAVNMTAPGNKFDRSQESIDSNITFGNRIKLDFDTSFTGKDRLTTSLKTGNLAELDDATGTDMARTVFQGDRRNQLELDELSYRFPIGDRTRIRLVALGGSLTDFARSLNPLLDDTGTGAVSRFGQRNPIYRQGGGSGLGITHRFNHQFAFSLGYLTRNASNPVTGLTQSPYGAIAQLTASPSDIFDVALTYVRSYNSINTRTGSEIANDPFRNQSNAIVGNSLGLQSQFSLSQQVLLTGWFGWSHATATDLPENPHARIINWALTLSVTDLGKPGNLLGLVVGQPPRTIHNQFKVRQKPYLDPDFSLHLETFYRWQIVDNFHLTLGLVMILNPEHNRGNAPLYVGTLRSTFTF